MPSPPIEEQRAIALHLNLATKSIDDAKNKIINEIDLIREYRTRLIADVVTGQLDVREAAASLPDIKDTEGDFLLSDADSVEEDDDLTDDLRLSESADAAD